jgi:hypothetical protein
MNRLNQKSQEKEIDQIRKRMIRVLINQPKSVPVEKSSLKNQSLKNTNLLNSVVEKSK